MTLDSSCLAEREAEMLGVWWLPDLSDEGHEYQEPDHSSPGELSDNPSSPWELTTIGSLRSSRRGEIFGSIGRSFEYDVIWGVDSQGDALSLFDCWRSSMSFQSSSPRGGTEGWTVSWYTSGSAWVSQHTEIDRIIIRFDILPEWASGGSSPGFDFSLGPDALGLPEPKKYVADYDGSTITLHVGHNVRPSSEGYQASRISAFEIEESIRLDEVVDKWVKPLRLLLDLLTGTTAMITGVSVRAADVQRSLDLHSNLLYQIREQPEERQRQLHMLATRASLKRHGVNFSDLMTGYLSLYGSEHRAALQSLSESQSRLVDQSTASELLSAFQAIEQYHKVVIGGSHIPREEFRRLLDTAVEVIAERRQEWFRARVSSCNFKSLTKRIEEVINQAGNTAISIERLWPDFRTMVVDCRNRVAHGTSARDGERVLLYHSASLGLRWLLRHVYLRELGVLDNRVDQIIQNNDQFKRDLQLLEATVLP